MNHGFMLLRRNAYLIFVIFFTQAKFLESKIYTEIYTVNYQLTQLIANFSRQICKNLHQPKKIYMGISVGSVTNMRYAEATPAQMGIAR